MPRLFNVPDFYRSSAIAAIKSYRRNLDPKRQDILPTTLNFGPLQVKIARHFGFCFGVENAIDIAYRALEGNPGKRIFLLSEMIHNPEVNGDLVRRGVRFLMGTEGRRLVPFAELGPEDIVIVPAFGTTVEIQEELAAFGINPYLYDTTCPFVEKVWKKSYGLGQEGYSVIVHGKRAHEETRATFSHSAKQTPTLVVRDMVDVESLISFLKGDLPLEEFHSLFSEAMSPEFDPLRDLERVGVVNQTTMLASETEAIARRIKEAMVEIYGPEEIDRHFADTRDTLCYATNENQSATEALIASGADLALVVGGYNSSNTSHLVELCREHLPTFYIKDESEMLSNLQIRSFDLNTGQCKTTPGWLAEKRPLRVALTSGASCPDATVDRVLARLISFFSDARRLDEVLAELTQA